MGQSLLGGFAAGVEGFCQKATSPYSYVQCRGITQSASLYRRNPTSSTWVLYHAGVSFECGTYGGGACPSTSKLSYIDGNSPGPRNPCYYYRTVARATIVLRSGVSVSGITITSSEAGTPVCSGLAP